MLGRKGHNIWFTMTTKGGNTKIARITPDGTVKMRQVSGGAYAFNQPRKTTDGGMYVVTQGDPGKENIVLGGVDPQDWKVKSSTAKHVGSLAFWPTVADAQGRFWAQGNVIDKGIAVVGAGLDKKQALVQTDLGSDQSGVDASIANPLVLGPDHHLWILGSRGEGEGLEIDSLGPQGIRSKARPKGVNVAFLSLVPAAGRVWSVGADDTDGQLVAVGVAPGGAATTAPTTLFNECFSDSARPLNDGAGGLWFTGADRSCRPASELGLARVSTMDGTATSTDTGLRVLGDAASSVVPVDGGVLVAGIGMGSLAFARVSTDDPTDVVQVDTGLTPYLANEQSRYPIVQDRAGGAWAQAVNAQGNLVLVHVTGTTVSAVETGLKPVARGLRVRSGGTLWAQGLNGKGNLVIVSVDSGGAVTTYGTGLAPAQFGFVMNPRYDGEGHLWFQGVSPSTGNLVMVRVPAGS